MSADDLIKTLATSPVLVAAIPAVIALVGGRYLLQAKDERIAAMKDAHASELKAKDAELAAAQLWSPAKMKEQVEGLMRLNEIRTEQLTASLQKAEEDRSLSDSQRAKLEAELESERAKLADMRPLLEEAQASLAKLMSSEVLPGGHWVMDFAANTKTWISPLLPGTELVLPIAPDRARRSAYRKRGTARGLYRVDDLFSDDEPPEDETPPN